MFNTKWATNFYAKLFLNDLSPGTINYFMRQAAACSNAQWGRKNQQLAEDVLSLEEHIDKILPVCTPAHTASGLKYLNNIAYTPTGKIRNTVDAKMFTMDDLAVLAIPQRIRFVGIHEYNASSIGSFRSAFMAMYRVEGEHAYFTYVMRPWQSGAYFSIVARGEELP